jgi:hypothetical protein
MLQSDDLTVTETHKSTGDADTERGANSGGAY